MMRTVGFILVVVGMMVAAGSANDCDGKSAHERDPLAPEP